MANLKISELDAGTTPLVGDELVAVVQAGATVRVPSSALKGLQGDPGDDGREVELQKGTTHIQWRYVGDSTWTDLVSLDDITGPPGTGGAPQWDDIEGKPDLVLEGDSRLSDARTPTGGAGGVLSGTFPNPGFAVDMATQGELDTQISLVYTAIDDLDTAKVDKVTGKGLSTEDYTTAEKTKLSGIATAATANSSDATLLARANHTGTQAISTVTGLQAALDAKVASTEKGAANGVASLGSDSKILVAQLPAIAITDVFAVASQAAMLALTAETGDIAVRSDLNKTFVLSTNSPSTLADWIELKTPTDAVLSVAGRTGAVTLAKADVGLNNVDNTADTAKPVSTAQQTALDGKLSDAPSDGTTYGRKDGAWAAISSGGGVPDLTRSARTSNTALTTTDKGTWVDITSGTFTQTLVAVATLTSGWWCVLENSGTGDITIDPNGSETIDGLTTFIIYPGERRLIQCDGTVLRSTVEKAFRRSYMTAGSYTFTKPPGYPFIGARITGAGGGGSFSGGGGGATVELMLEASLVGTTQSVVVGAGGAKNTSGGQAGVGGNSTFVATSYGGGGGNGGTSPGYGGGYLGAGSSATQGAPVAPSGVDNQFGGASSSTGSSNAGSSVYGGGGGGSTGSGTFRNGGRSIYGGGGGAGSDGNAGAVGGASTYAGKGGDSAGATATAPTAPGGGGAGTIPATNATDGAPGGVLIWGTM